MFSISDNPAYAGLEIESAKGVYLYDYSGKSYIDLISGISVNNLGHRHPKIIHSIKNQLDKYLHLMVFGQYRQSLQLQLSDMLSDNLPENLNCCFFVNSGCEAVEGAIKLARLYTGRSELVSFNNAYHGSTLGALSIMGNENLKKEFYPLLPNCQLIEFNNSNDLKNITTNTACVIAETIQGEAGAIVPNNDFLRKLRNRCDATGALLILDEIQTGYGRTGSLFAFEQYEIIPDIITIAKAMGGGMPIGAFISSIEIMDSLKSTKIPGHMTTFGGHPVSCAAAIETLHVLMEDNIIENVKPKGELFKKLLSHKEIKNIRGEGLLLALELKSPDFAKAVINECMKNGIITDSFLFAENCLRIAPPLIITEEEIASSCEAILISIENA